MPWIVNLDRVPAWQRDRWVEPIRDRVHGPAYFSRDHPVMRMIGETAPPDYGRMMVCQDGRLLAWVGLYVDGKHAFGTTEHEALAEVSAQLTLPLRIATALQARSPRIALASRQREIMRARRTWLDQQANRQGPRDLSCDREDAAGAPIPRVGLEQPRWAGAVVA